MVDAPPKAPVKKAKPSSSTEGMKKRAKDANVNDTRKSPPEETVKAAPIPKEATAASTNSSLHFNDKNEEEDEVKSKAPAKSMDADGDKDRVDDKDSRPPTKYEQSAFHHNHFEFISKCKFNF